MKEQTKRFLHRLHVRITAFLIVFAMACTAMASLPLEVFAATSDKCGTNLTWELNESTKTLTITGSGNMYNYSYDMPWYSNRNKIETIELEGKITSIGNGAFHNWISAWMR